MYLLNKRVNLLYFEHISTGFGINLHINLHEFVAIVGPSGSGKSTLMKILAGAHLMDSGKVIFEGKEVELNLPKDRTYFPLIDCQVYSIDNNSSVK